MESAAVWIATGFALVAFPVSLRAQDTPATLTPPRLTAFVEAEWPEDAVESGIEEVAVELSITIGADGQVSEVAVVASGGESFDARAVAAAERFVFEPARRGETPVPSRIRYRYVFERRPPPEAVVPPEEPAAESVEEAPAAVAPEPEDTEVFGATARVDPPPREVTRRSIEREELLRIPGTRGDPLRAIELLPGVGRPPFLAGLVIIRGSAPGDSQVFLEGMPVPLLYHFGGLTSFFNGRLLERIDFYPGNFSSRFGRKIGGVIDVGVRDPRTDGYHGVADLNLVDASILVEGPIGENASFALAFRRSYIDFFFSEVVPRGTFDTLAAPVYYDYQAIGTWRPTSDDRIRLLVYGSSDKFNIVLPPNGDSDPAGSGNLDLSTEFHRAQLSWRRRVSDDVDLNLEVAVGPTNLRFSLGPSLGLNLQTIGITGRAEMTARLSPRVRLQWGLDINLSPTEVAFRGPQPSQGEGNPGGGPVGTRMTITSAAQAVAYRPAVYAETTWQPIDPLTFVLGLRLDWYREIQSWSFDPRLVARWAITGQTTLKAGVGMFTQPPEFQEAAPVIGNSDLRPIRAVHVTAGADHAFDDTWSIGVEGFYKHLYERVVATTGSAPPFFENDGTGRIVGLEVAGRARATGRFFGFLSYTLMSSERQDHKGPWRPFDYDQTHILTLSGTYRLGDGWEAGGTFRLISGNPRTPVVGSIYNANADLYSPVYGPVNSARNDWFHRLDLRVEKQFLLDHGWKIAVYLDVQNVYNNRNPEGFQYNFNYAQSSVIQGLPIIPSLGIRGEL